MPNVKDFNAQEDDIYESLRTLYYEVMDLRASYMRRRMKGEKNLDDMKQRADEIDDDFKTLAKTHTIFLRLEKASGVKNPAHSEEMVKRINDIKLNIGKIVTDVPKQ